MAKGTDIRIGPWPDGINMLDQPDQIRDTQLVSCTNLDPDNTGVLIPRRPIRYKAQDATTQTKYLLGTIIRDGQTQPEAMTCTYDGASCFFKSIGDPTAAPVSWTNSRAGLFKSVVQYQNKIWYVPAVTTSVGASSPANSVNTFTSVAAMPYGDYGFVLKDRLFIVRKATSELYFSKATDFTVWAAPDGGVIQVNPGDNNPITKVVVVNNQVIIFKRDSTYVLSFTASPTGDGVVRQVSADQGALDAITYNNEVYCYNARSVFKFVNGFFQDIGLQLALPINDTIDASATSPAKISVVGKTLIFGTTPSGKNYAMNLDTGAWTSYTLPVGAGASLSISTSTIFSRSAKGTAIFFGDDTGRLSYMLVDRAGGSADIGADDIAQIPSYAFTTKNFDFDDDQAWKRLYSWHLSIEGDLSLLSPNAILNTGTSMDTTDVLGLIGGGTVKSSRFKRVSFGLLANGFISGTINTALKYGPTVRGIRAVIGAKAPVSV